MKKFLLSVLLLFFINTSFSQEWNVLKTGAGGWITGMNIHPTGNPIYARSDVGGAYRFEEATNSWKQIVTSNSMPSDEIDYQKYTGVLSIVAAPSNANIAYMAYDNAIYKTTNKGETWLKTGLDFLEMNPNDDNSKLHGERLAVDPKNENIVLFGSINNGMYRTTDGGITWSNITSIPFGTTERGVRKIVFLPDLTAVPFTNVLFSSIDGEDIYKSDNNGLSWSALNCGVQNPYFFDLEIDNSGNVYIAGDSNANANFGVKKYDGNTWNTIFQENFSISCIAINPLNPNTILLFSYGFDEIRKTTNANSSTPTWQTISHTRIAPNIPWISTTASNWFSLGEIVFDPIVENKLWIANGLGTWTTTMTNEPSMIWQEKAKSQEHLVSNDVVALPDNKVITAHWDNPLFLHNDVNEYPSEMKPNTRFQSSWSLDYSPQDPNKIVAVISDHRFCCNDGFEENSGYSLDGGQTWTRFATMPKTGEIFGQIAPSATDFDNMVWLPAANDMPYYTFDKGLTWNQATLPNHSEDCCLGAFFFKRWALTADRVLANTFYIYDWGNGSVYKSTNGGATWIQQQNALGTYSFNGKLMSVPTQAGHLLFTNGPEEALNFIEGLKISTNGGQSFSEITNTNQVLNVAVGKSQTPNGYPTLFIQGKVNDIFGFYMSTNQGVDWTLIGENPLGLYANATVMEGDMNNFGRLYVGFAGNGFIYYDADELLSTPSVTYANSASIVLHPNPTKDYLTIETPNELMSSISIYSMSGKLIERIKASSNTKTIDVQKLVAGIYLLEIISSEGTKSYQKFVKK